MARRRVNDGERESFLFEVLDWEPSYSFSTNRSGETDDQYSEYAELHFETVCTEPKSVAGRPASMILSSRRNFLARRAREQERPTNIGFLHLRKPSGGFYAGVP